MEEKLKANAQLVLKVAKQQTGDEVDYGEAGVRWLDAFTDGQRERGDSASREQLLSTLGSFLGECICRTFGGTWAQDDEYGWGVKVNDRLTVYPFNKVRKQLESGDGESVLSFFETIPAILRGMPQRTSHG